MPSLESYVPPFINNTKTFAQIFNTEDEEFNVLNTDINDIKAQLNVDTATWALDIYEKELSITTDYTKPLDYRRSVVKSKSRGTGKLNAAMIKLVCDAFTNGDVQVTFDGTIHVTFTSVKGIPPNMSDLQNAIELIKPAFLILDYIYIYLTWDQFENYNKTFDEWDALNLTWDGFETYQG